MLKRYALLAALVLVLAPASARADWLFTPNIGTTFKGSAGGNEHFTYGAAIGWMGAGIIGWEADFQYTPEFFKPEDSSFNFIDGSNVVSAMGNVIVGVPIGGQTGGGVRPFVTGGVGLLRANIDSADELVDISSNDFGFNLGAGVMGFMSDHIGLRGDVRYVRSFEDLDDSLDAGSFNFWRANAGVTFRW